MITITLTESELRTLNIFLCCNPCRAHCVHEYAKISCFDNKDNGDYKCELMRNRDNIFKKIYEQKYNKETLYGI